jgi:hypothetical protein
MASTPVVDGLVQALADELHQPLVPLGYFVDWRVVRDHGERALRMGLEATGLAAACRTPSVAQAVRPARPSVSHESAR